MALDSYANFKTAIGDWLARSDLATPIDDMIDLAESRIYRELRVRQMETALSAATSSGVLALPTGYVELRHAYVDGSPVQWLDILTAQQMYLFYETRSVSAKPSKIAREGANFIFGPFPDKDYTIKGIYYKKLDPLSGSNTTNWLTDDAPELLLFAALVESAPYIGEDERLAVWEGKYQQAKANVIREYGNERFPSGMTLRQRTA